MKNFCAAMKIFVLAAILIFHAKVSAYDYRSVDVSYLENIIGNWYDTKGNLVLTISKDYKLNGCQIMSVGFTADTAGLYKIIFKDGNQDKCIEVIATGSYEKHSDHEMLIFNENALRRTKTPKYFESVGGIYIGISQNEVLKLYGEPSSKESHIWKYKNLGLEVAISWGIVTWIKIYSYGDRKFDWSGLSARSSKSAFENKYRTSMSRRGSLDIGHGEVINVSDNEVTLNVFTPGYVF